MVSLSAYSTYSDVTYKERKPNGNSGLESTLQKLLNHCACELSGEPVYDFYLDDLDAHRLDLEEIIDFWGEQAESSPRQEKSVLGNNKTKTDKTYLEPLGVIVKPNCFWIFVLVRFWKSSIAEYQQRCANTVKVPKSGKTGLLPFVSRNCSRWTWKTISMSPVIRGW